MAAVTGPGRARFHGRRHGPAPPPLRPSLGKPVPLPVCLLCCLVSRRFTVPPIAFGSRNRQRILSFSHSSPSTLAMLTQQPLLTAASCEHWHDPLQRRLARPPSPKTQLVLVPYSEISLSRSLVFLYMLFILLFNMKQFLLSGDQEGDSWPLSGIAVRDVNKLPVCSGLPLHHVKNFKKLAKQTQACY